MYNNGEHEIIVRVQQPLVEKKSYVKNCYVDAYLNIDNNLRLKWQHIKVKKNYFIQFLDVNNCAVFLFFIAVRLLNNKDGKSEGGGIVSKLELALAVHLIKGFVYKMIRVITETINSWFYSSYLQFLSGFKMNLYPILRRHLNKAFRFSNKRVLGHYSDIFPTATLFLYTFMSLLSYVLMAVSVKTGEILAYRLRKG